MASKATFGSSRVKTILYWVAIVVLFVLFLGFLIAYITKREATDNVLPTESPLTTPTPFTENEVRLDDYILPTGYRLEVKSDQEKNQFSGTVNIDIEIKRDADLLRIHCKNLEIKDYKLKDSTGTVVLFRNVQIDTRLELCLFIPKEKIPSKSYILTIEYTGKFMPGQITGFYKSNYTTVDNQVRHLTATKFEPTYARMAFPCFDEPKFKTKFDISVIHARSQVALSNEIEQSIVLLEDGWTKTTFKQTVPMPTYLVAFIVCDFKYTETRTNFGTRVRVYSRPDQIGKTRYALETAAQVLHFYENYTAIPYAFTKLDLIGLPEFVSGAMENWGLVTYKETLVLYSYNESSAFDMRRIAGVISHELAHMWFGNLVTLKWWNDLWLNEGFASFFEFKGQNEANKSWNALDMVITGDIHPALRADSQQSARSLVNSVLTPNQITAMFDTFSYSKGASILSMIEAIIGRDAFQNDTRNYLNERKFGSVDTAFMIDHFKDDIKKVTKIDGDKYLNKYLYSNSYPILTVKRDSRSNNSLQIVQTAYNANQSLVLEQPWMVHVEYLLANNRNGSFVLSKTSQAVQLVSHLESREWFKLNRNSNGYYIVNYQPSDWDLLISQLKQNHKNIPKKDRANLLFDANQLSDKSLLNYETLFGLLDYLKKENEPLPWSVASSTLGSIQTKLISTNSFSIVQFKAYVRSLLKYIYDSKVNFASDLSSMTFEQLSLQNTLISLACRVEYEKCINQASVVFRNWLDNGVRVDPNVRSFVYKYGLQTSRNENDWKRVWDLYQAEMDALEKAKLMSALTSSTSRTLLLTLISYSQNQSIINNENFFSVQSSIASSSELGRALVWDYIKNNWPMLVKRFGLNDRRLGNYVKSVTSGFGISSRLNEMNDFFAQYPDAGAGASARASALEAVKKNIQWSEDNGLQISESLKSRDQYANPWLRWRLDDFVRPAQYEVNLTIDIDKAKFNGSVSIVVDVQRPIRHLILHTKDLLITSSNLHTKDRTLLSRDNAGFAYLPNQFWVIPMERIISPGQYVAVLTFLGKVGASLTGLYLSQYISSDTNEPVKLATTQFQAGYARKAFPCFDEPQFKAVFTISISHSSKYSAVSNMPVDYIRSSQDMQTTVFKPTIRMSTYLVAFVVSDFASKRSNHSSNFAVYTYNPKVNLVKTDYALTVGPKILDYFAKQYFNIAYPLPKMDMISIPDFSFGAMENWGLVTYRDVYLLYDEKKTSSASKMSICSIIAHELAHMWYGNLVTIKWWDDLWLNEGFAEFMMYKATAAVEPTWNYMDHFVIKESNRVLNLDSSLSTHAILTVVQDENAMQSIFDSVTYAKGASIIRMLESVVGEDNFRLAVTNYLNKHAYGNTVTSDLWREFTDVLAHQRIDVANLMDTWIRKEGFPVVTVSISSDGTFFLRQERFLKDFDHSNSTYTWFIPLTYRVIEPSNSDLDNSVGRIDFGSRTKNTKIAEYTNSSLVKFNVNQTGVFLVNYPVSTWNRFIESLNDNTSVVWQKLSSLDRNNLLSDAFYLSRSGRLSYDVTLRLVQFLKHEQSYIVWKTASDMLMYIRTFAIKEDKGIAFNQWLLNNVIGTLYDQLGWESSVEDDLNRRQLRALILDLTCMADHEICLQTANDKFREFKQQVDSSSNKVKRSVIQQNYSLDPDTFNVFLFHTMRTVKEETDKDMFDFLLRQFRSALSTNEKLRYLRALCAVQSASLLEQLVAKSLDTDFIRAQDYFTFLSFLSSNPVGLEIGWKLFRDNFTSIQSRFGLDDPNLGGAIYRFATFFHSQDRLQQVNEFYARYPKAGAGELYRQQALELIEANVQWSKKFYNQVIEHVTTRCDSKICPWNVFRLTNSVIPFAYHLTIQVNTNTFLYNGSVQAQVEVHKPVKYIIMHAANILKTRKPSVRLMPNVTSTEEADYSLGTGFRYDPLEFYVIPLRQQLNGGRKYSVEVFFEGSLLLGGTVGLYRGHYRHDNETVNLAATQFESTHARKVFPCFDEPHFKQNIYTKIIHEKSMSMTLSNMPIVETAEYKAIPGWMQTTYQRSVKMVTYLLAILVSDFQCSYTTAPNIGPADHINISTCASKSHKLDKHQYSLNVTPAILRHYESYLKQPYQIEKLDQIALPQFSPGAMENWGLVKYREKLLLWTDDQESSAEQRSVVAVIAHELAHMWFGNLVTCDFWGDLWLNEAFASYMEYSAVASVHPDWNYFDTIVYYDLFAAMLADSSESSQPIVRNVTTPAMMDYSSAIVYNKGSSILHMFNTTMGSENFQKSLRDYLEQNQYKSATTDQLFAQFAVNWNYEQNVSDFLRSWTYQPGFPYLNISYNSTDQSYSYTQERFLQNGARPSKDNLYVVPFSYYTWNSKTNSLQPSTIQWLTAKSGTLPSSFANSTKVNPNFNAFYLVNYPEKYWKELSDKMVVNSNKLVDAMTVNDRAEMLVSSFLLARAKFTSYLTPFRLFLYLINEKHFIPWYFYDYSLSYLALRMDRTEYRESLMQFERRLTSAHYTNVDFWDDSKGTNLDKSFRQLLITITCRSNNPQCLSDAYQRFSAWKKSDGASEMLPPNLRGNILCYGVRFTTDKSDYEFVWRQYLKKDVIAPLKLVYLQALSFISNWGTLQQYLDSSLNETLVSNANFVSFFSYVIQNYAHESNAWKYFVNNYSMFARKLSSTQIDQIMARFATYSVTSERKQQINTFFAEMSNVGSENGRKSVLQTMDSNIAWMNNRKTEVGEWLTQNGCGDVLESRSPRACPWGALRINKTVIQPVAYSLLIQVNVTNHIYNGTVDITLKAMKDLSYVTLNAAPKLSVKLLSITGPNNLTVGGQLFRYKPQDYVVIRFDSSQPPGQYVLKLSFNSTLLDAGLSGLYLSNYTSHGKTSGIASTQFEFYDARKVFPCFDEPAFKAKFSLAIVHDQRMNGTLSNMDITSSEPVDGMPNWTLTRYQESPLMTTYLVAMLVSDFVCINRSSNNIRYGVCASRTQQLKMEYALETAPKHLQHLESITQIAYPLNKVDLVAIPDFNYGAMENWGLITFRETALLYSDADTTSASKISVSAIIAHELAHFWFGNLVTCEWWDNLWLNEAFATYMEYTTVNASQPDWNFFDMFLMHEFESAVNADSADTAHSLLRPITSTPQIDQYSSSIIYAKGASILRMVEFVMKTDPFYASIRKYLKDNSYKTVKAKDLFIQLDANFSPVDDVKTATDFLDHWVNQKGFPYVNVSKEANGSYMIKQERFVLTTPSSTNTSNATTWKIPFSYYNDKQWLQSSIRFVTKTEQVLTTVPPYDLVKFNAGHKGFYLVNYSPDLWNGWIDALADKFERTNLPPVDRAGLLLDSFYLARANLLSYTTPLKLTRYLVKETHITPWTIAIRALNSISKNIVFGSSYGTQFQLYIQDLVSPVYSKLGWNDSQGSEPQRQLRASILDFACANKYGHCLERASILFKQWKSDISLNGKSAIAPNLLSIVLKYGLQADPKPENWLFVWSQYLKETSATLKTMYLVSLGSTPDQNLITMLLNQALEGKVIRSQDANMVFSVIVNSRNRTSIEHLWQFYKSNYVRLASRGSVLRPTQLSSLLNAICSNHLFTNDKKTELQSFFAQHANIGLTSGQRTAALNTIDSNIVWLKKRLIEVENFLLCNEHSCPFTVFRLNEEVSPLRYALSLKVDLENERFEGSVKIETTVSGQSAASLRFITLNAASTLNITSSKVRNSFTKQELSLKRAFAYKPYDFWVIELENILQSSKIELEFEFNSQLATDMYGFYLSRYYDPSQKKTVKLASTQFQATYARRAFPCFDEPSFKSIFQVSLTHSRSYTGTMSNQIVSEVRDNLDGTVTTFFQNTPPMVTYLLAFVVSDFACVSNSTTTNDVAVRLCSSPPQIDRVQYAMEISPQLIDMMSNKFQFNYSSALTKMDIVAIPDFSAGAMENWGLLTFRETALLWDRKLSSANDKMRVASVVAHEIAHMWFGNLVTCQWWSHLWLNEAFASYLEYFAVAKIEPSWDYWQLFYITDFIPGLNADASSTAHPLVRVVNAPGDIPYISNIIYQKGSSVLRMFEFVLSTDRFFAALGRYLQIHQYTSISSSVLIDALSEVQVSKLSNTSQFISSWTKQAGLPYLTLKYYNQTNSYLVTQQRFFSTGRVADNSQTWFIPLSYYTNYQVSSNNTIEYITERSQNITVQVTSPDELPIKFNKDSLGFYIVNYSPEDWQRWIRLFQNPQAIATLKLTTQDYSQLVYDAFMLSGANLLPYSTALDLTALLRHNEMFSVWHTGSTVFGQLWPFFRTNHTFGINALMQTAYHKYAQTLVQNIYNKYGLQGVDDESVVVQRLRTTVCSFACAYRLDRCLLEAQVEFKKWRSLNTTLSPNIRSTVLRYAIQQSEDQSDWHYLWTAYTNAWQTSVKLDYLQGLSQTTDKGLLRLLFHRANDQTLVRRQDYLSLFSYAVRTSTGFEVAWAHYTDNYKKIRANRLSAAQMGTVANYFARYLHTASQKADFQRFFVNHPDTGISATSLALAVEVITKNINWVNNNRAPFYDWLRVKNSQSSLPSD